MNINLSEIWKNAQKIQDQMGSLQEKLGGLRITGSAGGGMAEVDMNGRMEVLAVRIAPEAMDGGDREMLQDLMAAAFSSAMEKVHETVNREFGGMFPGGKIPILQGGLTPGMPGSPA